MIKKSEIHYLESVEKMISDYTEHQEEIDKIQRELEIDFKKEAKKRKNDKPDVKIKKRSPEEIKKLINKYKSKDGKYKLKNRKRSKSKKIKKNRKKSR